MRNTLRGVGASTLTHAWPHSARSLASRCRPAAGACALDHVGSCSRAAGHRGCVGSDAEGAARCGLHCSQRAGAPRRRCTEGHLAVRAALRESREADDGGLGGARGVGSLSGCIRPGIVRAVACVCTRTPCAMVTAAVAGTAAPRWTKTGSCPRQLRRGGWCASQRRRLRSWSRYCTRHVPPHAPACRASRRCPMQRVRDKQRELEEDEGPARALSHMRGRCYEKQQQVRPRDRVLTWLRTLRHPRHTHPALAQQYLYKVCPFDKAHQDNTLLGKWEPWSAEGDAHGRHLVWQFLHGTPCWNGPSRCACTQSPPATVCV